MTTETPTTVSVFGGALRADAQGALRWRDDESLETRATVRTRGQMAPSYLIRGGVVLVPRGDARDSHPQADLGWVARYHTLDRLGRPTRDERGRVCHCVPLSDWDAWAAAPGGVTWDRADEPAILDRAIRAGAEYLRPYRT